MDLFSAQRSSETPLAPMILGLLRIVWVFYKAALLLTNPEPVFDANGKALLKLMKGRGLVLLGGLFRLH